jgi:hypothetical protein
MPVQRCWLGVPKKYLLSVAPLRFLGFARNDSLQKLLTRARRSGKPRDELSHRLEACATTVRSSGAHRRPEVCPTSNEGATPTIVIPKRSEESQRAQA